MIGTITKFLREEHGKYVYSAKFPYKKNPETVFKCPRLEIGTRIYAKPLTDMTPGTNVIDAWEFQGEELKM